MRAQTMRIKEGEQLEDVARLMLNRGVNWADVHG